MSAALLVYAHVPMRMPPPLPSPPLLPVQWGGWRCSTFQTTRWQRLQWPMCYSQALAWAPCLCCRDWM